MSGNGRLFDSGVNFVVHVCQNNAPRVIFPLNLYSLLAFLFFVKYFIFRSNRTLSTLFCIAIFTTTGLQRRYSMYFDNNSDIRMQQRYILDASFFCEEWGSDVWWFRLGGFRPMGGLCPKGFGPTGDEHGEFCPGVYDRSPL